MSVGSNPAVSHHRHAADAGGWSSLHAGLVNRAKQELNGNERTPFGPKSLVKDMPDAVLLQFLEYVKSQNNNKNLSKQQSGSAFYAPVIDYDLLVRYGFLSSAVSASGGAQQARTASSVLQPQPSSTRSNVWYPQQGNTVIMAGLDDPNLGSSFPVTMLSSSRTPQVNNTGSNINGSHAVPATPKPKMNTSVIKSPTPATCMSCPQHLV